MFKRANKITALLVAAASVMSIVPAMAADNTRVGNKAGTVKQGVAFEGGKYAYYGYRGDADTGIWYNNGGEEKDTADSDLADYRFNNDSKYGEKYAYAQENSNEDEYLVDLSTGKIVTDETAEEKSDAAQAKLASNIKKADRYKDIITKTGDLDNKFDQILKGQFGEVWYQYTEAIDGTTTPKTYTDAFRTDFSVRVPAVTDAAGTAGLQADIDAAILKNAKALAALDTANAGTLGGSVSGLTTGASYLAADKISAQALLIDTDGVAGAPVVIPTADEKTALDAFIAVVDTTKELADAQVATGAGVTPVEVVQVQDAKYTVAFNGKPLPFTATGKVVGGTTTVTQADVVNTIKAYLKTLAPVTALFTDFTYDDATGDITASHYETKSGQIAAKITAADKAVPGSIATIDAADQRSTDANTTDGTLLTGFSNASGKYIDVSYNANMKVYSTLKGRAIMVDEYDKEVADAAVSVHLKAIEAVAQDKEFIYTYTTVDVTDTNNNTVTEQNFIQKISKAQGSKDADEAYVPKSVDSYQVDNKTIYDNGDMKDAYDVIHGTKDSDLVNLIGVEAKDNTLYVTRSKDDKVKVYKLSLKTVKADINPLIAGTKLKKDVDTNAVVLSGDKDTDIVEHTRADAADAEDLGLKGIENVLDRATNNNITLFGENVMRHPSVSIDVEGNVWALDEGQIKKITGLDVKNVNTCDRAMDAIDAYDDSSVIAWDISGDAYTTLKEGTKVTEDESTAVAPVIVTGWVQDGANWSFNDTTGAKVTAKWINVGGYWYFLKADGVMATGWYNDNGTWYFLKASGAMATGWIQDGANWYYLNASGAMLANTTVDGYVLGASGAWVK